MRPHLYKDISPHRDNKHKLHSGYFFHILDGVNLCLPEMRPLMGDITQVIGQRTWNICGMMIDGGKLKNSEGNLSQSNLFTKNPICTTIEVNLVV